MSIIVVLYGKHIAIPARLTNRLTDIDLIRDGWGHVGVFFIIVAAFHAFGFDCLFSKFQSWKI